MKKRDIFLIILLLALSGISYLWIQMNSHSGDQVIVTVDKKEVIRESLASNQELIVPLSNGKNIVTISNGKVSMREADCPDQICVKHKKISKSGESIICLPHKVVVEIVAEGDSDVDIMTQ